MSIGEMIKKYREKHRIQLTKMAIDTGIERSTLYRYETNAIKKIPPDKLVDVCRYLNIPFNEVINALVENNTSEYRLDRFKSLYMSKKDTGAFDPLQKSNKNDDKLQKLIDTLSPNERERAFNILEQVFLEQPVSNILED